MAYRKVLIQIEYHYDDDTGMYKVGEIDHSYGQELHNYLRDYGLEGRNNLMQALGFMAYTVQDLFLQIHKPPAGSCEMSAHT